MLGDSFFLNLLIAFFAGFLNFFFPCVLSVVPVQIAVLAGSGRDIKGGALRRRGFTNGLFFVSGFLLVFIALGVTVNTFSRALAPYRLPIVQAGGVLMVLIGLWILGIFKAPFFLRQFGFAPGRFLERWEKPRSFLLGLTFGFAWTPCIGPVLAVILFWASQSETFIQGFLLLGVFGMGIAVPFLVLSIFLDRVLPYFAGFGKFSRFAEGLMGLLIVLLGVLLVTNNLGFLISLTLRLQSGF